MKCSKVSSTADVIEQFLNRQRSKMDEKGARRARQKTSENRLEQGVEGLLSLQTSTPSMNVNLFNNR